MADVRRTLAALQALLADNVAGDISPQDLRDAIVSCAPAYGSLYFSSAAATVIGGASTPTKASGTTASVYASSDVTVATTNRLTYTAAPTLKALVSFAGSIVSASAAQAVNVSIAKNGTEVAASVISLIAGTAVTPVTIPPIAIELAQNDYVEVFVENDTSTATVTVSKGILSLQSLLV